MTPPESHKNVAVLGATPQSDRYAYRAMIMLKEHGYRAIPVNPAFLEVLGEPCFRNIGEVPEPIDTVTMYIGAVRSTPLIDEILAVKPRRIIFNPGAENQELSAQAARRGIEVVEGCTLVMLTTGTF